jgi:hypothetical protein
MNAILGGGVLPGTMVLIRGARGAGKTKLALGFAARGHDEEGRRGLVLDLSLKGDEQRHRPYAKVQSGWSLGPWDLDRPKILKKWPSERTVAARGYFHMAASDYEVESVDRDRLTFEEFEALNHRFDYRMALLEPFLFFHRYYGARRIIVDGLEPTGDPRGSVQHRLLHRLYARLLQASPGDLGREALRQGYGRSRARVARARFQARDAAVLVLETSQETSLDRLIRARVPPGALDPLATTVILMGERDLGDRVVPAVFVAKHRGAARDGRKLPLRLSARGVQVVL